MPTDTPNPPPVGPELDRAVAEAIGASGRTWEVLAYSTNLLSAFDALRATKTDYYEIICYEGKHHHVAIETDTEDALAYGYSYPTLPEAICRAVLAWAAARESGKEVRSDGE